MKQFLQIWQVLLIVALLLPVRAMPQELHVVTEDYAPYNYMLDGEVVGFSTEVLRVVLKRAEVGYQIEMLPWTRAYRTAQSTKDVLIYTIARTPERENRFYWVGPIAPRSVHLFRLREREDVAPTIEADLTHYTLGVVRADATELLARKWGFVEEKNLVVTKDFVTLTRLIDAGRIDLLPSNPWMFQHDIQRYGRNAEDYSSCYSVEFEQGYYFGISRGSNPELIERIRKAYHSLEQEGVLAEIRSRYDGSMFE